MNISKRTVAFITSGVLIIFSLTGLIFCLTHKFPNEGDIGSYYMPSLTFGLILILSIIKFFASAKEDSTKKKMTIDKQKTIKGICTVLLIGFYCLCFRAIGFAVTTLVFTIAQMALFYPSGKKRWGLILLIAVIVTVLAYLIFAVGFKLSLPAGILYGIL